jgi:hypothetical protein
MMGMTAVIDESSSANSPVVSFWDPRIRRPEQVLVAESVFIMMAHTIWEIVGNSPRTRLPSQKLIG